MLQATLVRGLKAGAVAGIAYGLFVAFIGTPLIEIAEAYETHDHAAAIPDLTATITSIGAGVLWGLLLGAIVFGFAYYLFEPALPGTTTTKSFILATAGFITISGAPWLVLPPQPPGIEHALPTDTRILWYAIMMATAALAITIAITLYNQLPTTSHTQRLTIAALPFLLLLIPLGLAPPNPTTGPVPDSVVTIFRATSVAGQLGLWLLLGTTHAWLANRTPASQPPTPPSPARDPQGSDL